MKNKYYQPTVYDKCESIINSGMIPRICYDKLNDELNYYSNNSKELLDILYKELNFWKKFQTLSSQSERELALNNAIFFSDRLNSLRSLASTSAFLKDNTIRVYSEAEIINNISSLEQTIDNTEEEIDNITEIKNIIDNEKNNIKRSNQLILHVTFANYGYSDAIIRPGGKLKIGGQEVILKRAIRYSPIISLSENTPDGFQILPMASIKVGIFEVDRQNSSQISLSILDSALQSNSPVEFEIVCNISNKNFSKRSNLPTETVSIEMESN